MRGRPILGAISGLFFGLFLSLNLMLWGIWPLDRVSVFGLPILFLIVGLGLAIVAPLGRSKAGGSVPSGSPLEDTTE
ncbi:MAG: hypothetical protein PVI35_03760 [Acidimicrobiia bacterium]